MDLRLPPKGADRSGSDDITLYVTDYTAAAPFGIYDCPRRGQMGSAHCCRRQQICDCPRRGQIDHRQSLWSKLPEAADLRLPPKGADRLCRLLPEDLRSPPKGADRSVSEDRFAIAPEGGRSLPKGAAAEG
jgi:hypothetical protein